MSEPLIAIVVLNWNGKNDTLECLHSLSSANYRNCLSIIVDNGSTDDSVAAIRAAFPDVMIIETKKNLGYAGGNNVGIRQALKIKADYITVLNNDTVAAKDMFDILLEAYQDEPAPAVL
ncbi:MAG: glycosyltransferase [Desulfosoma sp.]|uniref:glycosyltransferase n=1 Tax=Desulfosoma sp. TaxID=2603217 RepID=UPI00404B25DA